MEIKNFQVSSINAYKKLTKSTAVKKNDSVIKEANTDKVEFDFGRYLDTAKADAASKADPAASEDRLAALAQQYSGDNCPVSADALASAILA